MMKLLALRKAYLALSVFLVGALHLVIVRRATAPALELRLALVQNQYLDKPPSRIVVLGERRSGDDYAADVLRQAFGDRVHRHEHVLRSDLLGPEELREIARRTDILWVMAVRSPCDWADAVIEDQKEACEEGMLPSHQCKAHGFASDTDYYRIPWHDAPAESNNDINVVKSRGRISEYEDIFDMRSQKLMMMKQIVDAVPRHAKILRLRDFELNPDVFVKDLVKEYQFDVDRRYQPPPPAVNPESVFFDPKTIYSCMHFDKWREAQQRIDWTLEGFFGYNHLDCHLCRGSGQAINAGSPITPPSNIYILGERNSGTTFVSNTLAEAFDPPNTMGSKLEMFSSDIPVLLHKHMFRHDLLDQKELAEIKAREDILWIMVVRSPCDWAEGMFRKPYHFCPPKHPEKCGPESNPNDKVWMNQNSVAGMSLLDFFTKTPWKDWAESVPFLRDKTGEKGGEEVSISKVSANYTYPSVFALRRHKLEIMRQIIETVPRNVKFVRLKELERSPEVFIQSLVSEFNVTLKEGYKTQPPSKVAHPTTCLTPDEWEATQNMLDWGVEAEFGFSPCDCRMCYGYTRSTRLYSRIMAGKKINTLTGRAKANKADGGTSKAGKTKRGKSTKKRDNTSE
ncbi:hypothetical protein ACHAXT_006556 [Thalassiosira profunda]